MKQTIPVIDIEHLTSPDTPVYQAAVMRLGQALETYGFVAIENHGVNQDALLVETQKGGTDVRSRICRATRAALVGSRFGGACCMINPAWLCLTTYPSLVWPTHMTSGRSEVQCGPWSLGEGVLFRHVGMVAVRHLFYAAVA